MIAPLGGEVKAALLERVDDAFDFAARFGFGVAAGMLLLAALSAAVLLRAPAARARGAGSGRP